VGAPVTLLGLQAGEVTDVGFEMDPEALVVRGRVEFVAYPERLIAHLRTAQAAKTEKLVADEQQSHAFLQRLIEERGLRGQLRSGSLITGQLYVAFDYVKDAPKVTIDWSVPIPVIPTVPSTLPDLEAKVTGILDKVDKIPFETIGNEIRQVLATIDKAIADIDTGVTPELRSSLVEFRRALATAEGVLKDTDGTLLGPDAPIQLELRNALQEVARAARAVRVLADYLERNPGALIRGKGSAP
jgi:paraquat-inducible protein B